MEASVGPWRGMEAMVILTINEINGHINSDDDGAAWLGVKDGGG